MHHSSKEENQSAQRRQRIHELLIALIKQQESLELMNDDKPISDGQSNSSLVREIDPGAWMNRNRRVLQRYQALVHSAVTLDALLDAEQDGLGSSGL